VSVTEILQPPELAELERMLATDERMRARLAALLDEHSLRTLEITIDVSGGRVRLAGVVEDRLSALTIEDLAWSLPQVTDCENLLQVRDEGFSLAS
jgi:osmotically-inducible protein OsmY